MAKKLVTFNISNMTCVNCEIKIENKVRALTGVTSVKASYNQGTVQVEYDDSIISEKTIRENIKNLHYNIYDTIGGIGSQKGKNTESKNSKSKSSSTIGIILIIFAVYFVLNKFGLLNRIPQVDASMGFFALFVVGLITSLHCTAMCGGINIAQCMTYKQNKNRKSSFMPSLLYNTGRVISYTVIGGIVGALGSVISFSGYAKGIMALIAGIFMVIMGLNMLNIFPWLKKFSPRMPKFLGNKIHKKNNYGPFVVGLLNGLMPCGPLQAMQIYALGTGNALYGAMSMFMFSLGTVPLMFGLGALSSFLKEKSTQRILKVGAVLVIVLGFTMFNNGLALSGIQLNFATALPKDNTESKADAKTAQSYTNPAIVNGNVQEITTTLGRSYTPITVQKGIPVRWTIKAEKANINGCNNQMQIPKYNITQKLQPGDNVIEFTPTSSGVVPYSCWMGMIRSNITVVDDLQDVGTSKINEEAPDDLPADQPPNCCAVSGGSNFGG